MQKKLTKLMCLAFALVVASCAGNKSTPVDQTGKTVDVFYSGPGADERVMTAIIGKKPIKGRPAILHGYKLGVQNVSDIPEPARQTIESTFGPDFEIYVSYKGKGEILGVVWTITEEDLDAVKDWGLVEQNWYSLAEGDVTYSDATNGKVWLIAVENQHVQREVDGLDHDIWLGQGPKFQEKFLRNIAASRQRYLQRRSAMQKPVE